MCVILFASAAYDGRLKDDMSAYRASYSCMHRFYLMIYGHPVLALVYTSHVSIFCL